MFSRRVGRGADSLAGDARRSARERRAGRRPRAVWRGTAWGQSRRRRCAAPRRAPGARRAGAAAHGRAAGRDAGAALAALPPPRPCSRRPAGPGARPGKVRPGARPAGGAPRQVRVRGPAPGLAPRVESAGRLFGSVRFPLNGFTYS